MADKSEVHKKADIFRLHPRIYLLASFSLSTSLYNTWLCLHIVQP